MRLVYCGYCKQHFERNHFCNKEFFMNQENEKKVDTAVVHPKHYNKGIECWDYTTSHGMGFLDGNVVKYVTRFPHKNGLQDLYKARQYLEKLIETEEAKQKQVSG